MRLKQGVQRRVLGFDLENRPSAYWYDGATTAEITALAWKWTDEKTCRTLLLQPDGTFLADDGDSLDVGVAYVVFRDVLCSAGLIFGHNIRRHDLPMFQTGLLRLELPPLPPLLTSDTLRDLPTRKDMSASLDSLADMYRLGKPKMHMPLPAWERANKLLPEGMEDARKRCVSDVLLQERLRGKLLELDLLGGPQMWRPRRGA